MRDILIDTYKLKELYSGLGQFSLNFARELIKQQTRDLEIDFLIPRNFNEKIIDPGDATSFVRTSFQKRYLPSLNKKYRIWHSLHQFPSFYPGKNTPWILTIHDLNFLLEKNDKKAGKYLRRLQADVDRADHITTISNYSKEQIEKNLELNGKEVRVIYNGVADHPDVDGDKPSYIKKEHFFFTIGILNRKKNFHTLLPLMHHFEDHQLIIAGNKDTSYGRELEREIKKLGFENKVILPGKVSDEEKYWLHSHCRAFLFPSLAEGFGIPVIEAMKAGKPAFISKHTSLPEIGGDKAFYFDSFEEQQMVSLIKKELKSFEENCEVRSEELKEYARKFSWENCVKGYLELYNEALNLDQFGVSSYSII